MALAVSASLTRIFLFANTTLSMYRFKGAQHVLSFMHHGLSTHAQVRVEVLSPLQVPYSVGTVATLRWGNHAVDSCLPAPFVAKNGLGVLD